MSLPRMSSTADDGGVWDNLSGQLVVLVDELVDLVTAELVTVAAAQRQDVERGLRADLLDRQALLLDELAVLEPRDGDRANEFAAVLRAEAHRLRNGSEVDDWKAGR